MSEQYFNKWSEVAKKLQEPVQDIVELNVKTLQGLSYLKPEDLANAKRPEEILEKQVAIVIDNGHKTLDYMQQSFRIVESAMLNIVEEAKKAVKNH